MVRVPVVRGVIDRRVLVNFRVAPSVLQSVLPPPFRPKLVRSVGIAGICLIRLSKIRPRFVPRIFGLRSENAAHRIAVEWSTESGTREGVYIPRRDTSSRLNATLGGRFFPGEHNLAQFTVVESDDRLAIALRSQDGHTRVGVSGRLASTLPAGSVFPTLEEASRFFEGRSLGYSATARPSVYDGLELRSLDWVVQPLEVERVESSFFSDASVFPPESVQFDCALLMQRVSHEWHAQPSLDVRK